MKHLSSYAKVYQIGHAKIDGIFSDPVLIEEKYDGSQFCFGMIDGEFVCRSHNVDIDWQQGVDSMFQKAFDYAYSKVGILPDNTIFRCEYLQKEKHNTLRYLRIPKNNLVLFDVEIGLQPLIDSARKSQYAELLEIEPVQRIYKGIINTADELLKFLETESSLGGTKLEGIVIKNYNKYGDDKKYFVGKYVSEAFKEKHSTDWKDRNPSRSDVILKLGDEMRSAARWMKAIQHLKEDGKLENSPKDIGILLKEIHVDIEKDESEYIKEKLYSYAIKNIKSFAVRGFPEFYKKYLLENTFENKK